MISTGRQQGKPPVLVSRKGSVMRYKLRSDLNKTTVYMTVKQFAPVGVVLPVLRRCVFKKYRGSYWIYFDFDGHKFKAVMDVCLGKAYVSYELTECDMESLSAHAYEHFRRQVVNLDLDYLLSNGLVREVA